VLQQANDQFEGGPALSEIATDEDIQAALRLINQTAGGPAVWGNGCRHSTTSSRGECSRGSPDGSTLPKKDDAGRPHALYPQLVPWFASCRRCDESFSLLRGRASARVMMDRLALDRRRVQPSGTGRKHQLRGSERGVVMILRRAWIN
jgi:hypothetical protein